MMLPLEGPGGYRSIPYAKSVSVSGATFVITDACKHPEVAIQIADLFSSEEWAIRGQLGVQGIEWDYADEGTFGMDGVTPAKYKILPHDKPSQVKNAWWWTYRGMEPWKSLSRRWRHYGSAISNQALCRHNETIAFAADVDTMPPLSIQVKTVQTLLNYQLRSVIMLKSYCGVHYRKVTLRRTGTLSGRFEGLNYQI